MSGIQQLLLGGSPAGGYQIERSLRFNSADSANLTRTPSVNGNRKTWTWSAWIKRANPSQAGTIWGSNFASGGFGMAFGNYGGAGVEASRIGITLYAVGTVTTNAVFRDPSAWYHVVARFDSTQAAQADRFRLYVNNVQQTLSANLNVTQNADYHINESSRLHTLGGESGYFNDLYMAEVNHIDGQSLTPSSFGQSDPNTGVWSPIKYTGTYGTNGFFLSFSDNSNTTSTTLGKDSSGNGNNWTPNNFSVTAGAGNDSLVDTPTSYGTDTGVGGEVRGNYATTSPINQVGTALTLANGNLDFTQGSSLYGLSVCTMSIRDKTYFEITINATGVGRNSYDGVGSSGSANAYSSGGFFGTDATAWSLGYSNTTAYISNNGVQSTQSGTIANGDVFMYAVDPANGRIWFGRNGTWYAGNPSAGTGASYTNLPSEVWPVVQAYNSGAHSINFGQRPFAHTAPSGFKALCTQNLPTPTIGATSTTQANDYFNVVTYTGTDGVAGSVTGVGFQPDFIWGKSRSSAESNILIDVVRGGTKGLFSNLTLSEQTNSGYITSFNADGFSYGVSSSFSNGSMVAWNWKANGAGSSNTAGTITSTVSANTTAGFSIVTWAGSGAAGTIGHGLGAVPGMLITKNRNQGTDGNWVVWHRSLTGSNTVTDAYYMYLNGTNGQNASGGVFYKGTDITSTTFGFQGGNTNVNASGSNYVCYAFAPVAGYSAFGSYTGNGSTDGPFVYTGFRPRYVMFKRTDAVEGWYMYDTARTTINVMGAELRADSSAAESDFSSRDFLSNGFKIRTANGSVNASGGTYIYAAFAESPFKYSLAR